MGEANMEGLINERGKLIIKSLVTKGTLTLRELKTICNVSERTISKDLDTLEQLIKKYKLTLVRKPKLGIWIDGEAADKEKLFVSINVASTTIPNTPKERQDYILLKLILATKYITMQELCDEIYISRGTLENDLVVIENIVRKNGLNLKKVTNKGIKLTGDEKKLRMLIADFFANITYSMSSRDLVNHIKASDKNMSEFSIEKNLFHLFSDLDLKSLQGIMCQAEDRLGYMFTDVAFTSLLIHLAIAIKRLESKNEINLPDKTTENMLALKEYETAEFIAEEIERTLGIKLPKTECAYITIHILGAKVQYNLFKEDEKFLNRIEVQGEIENLCKEMICRASEVMDMNFNEDMILLKGLLMHIKAALNRVLHEIPVKNPLLDNIKSSYVSSFEAAVASSEVIKERYKAIVDESEIAYIALHFEAAAERKRSRNSAKSRVLIICSSGIGTSQLVASKLKRVFDNLEIVDIVSSQSIDEDKLNGIDFIITTIPLMISLIPVIRVNPLLLEEDLENIKSFIISSSSNTLKKQKEGAKLLKLIDKDLIFIREKFETREEAIKGLSEVLTRKNFVGEDFYRSVLAREQIASTAIGRVSMPHGDMNNVYKSAVCICTLQKKVQWDENKVDCILMLAIRKKDVLKTQHIFDSLYDIISDGKIINKIVNCGSKEQVISLISS
jgi:transcriptional antiterminator